MSSSYVGHVHRTAFASYRVDHHEARAVAFPFGSGFGCGETLKVANGYKTSLQTQLKATSGLGWKVNSPLELSASTSVERSITISHEFTFALEWSYTAPACHYCQPEIVFPDATITIWTKMPLHLPLFVSKITNFAAGQRSQIRSNCVNDPEGCPGCAEEQASQAKDRLVSHLIPERGSQIHHVVSADRAATLAPEHVLDGMHFDDAQQLYFVAIDGSLTNAAKEAVLLNVDELDRQLAAVRVMEGKNTLQFLVRGGANEEYQASIDGEPGNLTLSTQRIAHSGYQLLTLTVPIGKDRGQSDEPMTLILYGSGRPKSWELRVLSSGHPVPEGALKKSIKVGPPLP